MSALWPEMLQWSWMGEGDFWCSLNLSAKVLADSPMYSSSHPTSLHLNLYITPLLLVIGSLSLGFIRRSFMVWPPLKCTCTPYFWQVFLNLSLSPCWYGTTMYMFFWIVFFWPVWLLLFLLLEGFWLFIFALLMAQSGYLHLCRAWHRCSSSFFCNCGSEHTVLALWNRVPATLYFDDMVCWLSHYRYKSVWVGFLNTDVLRLTSSFGVTRMSKNGIDPIISNFFTGEGDVLVDGVQMFQEAISIFFLYYCKSVIHKPLP